MFTFARVQGKPLKYFCNLCINKIWVFRNLMRHDLFINGTVKIEINKIKVIGPYSFLKTSKTLHIVSFKLCESLFHVNILWKFIEDQTFPYRQCDEKVYVQHIWMNVTWQILLEIELLYIKCKRSAVGLNITKHKTKIHFIKGGKFFQRIWEIIFNKPKIAISINFK